MTTDTTPRPCGMPGCDDPHYADGLCEDHHRQFHPDATEPRESAPQPVAAAPAPSGRLRLSPMFALVGCDADGVAGAVYGVYGTGDLAQSASGMISALGIPGRMQIVPFYEVTP